MQRAIEVSRLRSQVKREGAQLVETVKGMMRDLEVLYGADGLQAHFEAFMARVDAERQASSTASNPRSNNPG